jgi:hypothetical protein
LIQQRLEQMEVAAVDKGKIDGGPMQGLGGVEPAESSAKNYDAVRYTRSRHA